ncbi:MAG: hypothetical protein LUD07_04510 [Clostridiales bacterium]|nr:hypothetical protein [Clostridiales bacterium]
MNEGDILIYHSGVVIPMGVKDTMTAKYMQRNEIFADAFNYYVYGGRQVIDPNSLEELDTREIGVPYGSAEDVEQPVQRIRDVIKSVIAMTNKKAAFLVLAVENQGNVHYAMAVKDMVYDALQYAKQVEKAIASHKKAGDYKGADSDEYLSGFMKDDKLMPVATLVIYFGPKAWDGPMSIHEMFEYDDEEMLAIVPDYKINLIAPEALSNVDFDKFNTSLKEVLTFIKYSGDADKLEDAVNSDEGFQHLGRTEVDVLNACVNASLTMGESEVELNVCQAIQTLNQRAEEKGRIENLTQNIKSLMESMGWTAEETMNNLKVSESDRKVIAPRF